MNHVIAFDVSMGKNYMVIYNAEQRCEFEGVIQHNQLHFKKLLEQIVMITERTREVPGIVFEATGVYSGQLERLFRDNNLPYTKLNPLEAKLQTAAMRMHKTDKSDAHRLAQTHISHKRRNHHPQGIYFDQMRALSRYYTETEKEIKTIRSRLHSLIQLSFPELESLFSPNSRLFAKVVKLFPHPDYVISLSKTVIRNRIKSNTDKNISFKNAQEKSTALIEAAQCSYPAIEHNDVRCLQLQEHAERMLETMDRKEEIIKEMIGLSNDKKEFEILKSVPGIGDNTAVRLIAEMGDVSRFDNNKQLNAYAGIDIRRFESGTLFYKDKINKRGNKELRKILYYTIQNMIKLCRFGGNHLVDYYDRLKKQPYNKCHKVASIACVNKLLKVIFHLITHNQIYNYEIATQQS
ncbi:IS110 family transposase [Oceanobacillus sp. FSL H7-0719]|uniref:IS110 family transposase n=1 Tax=Oceanobacillus sp. FSL H7-0719 TaxID=2954507 RepID=UPI003249B48E